MRNALEGEPDLVVSAIEVGAHGKDCGKRTFEIPLKCGVRQPYAENGGPGGFWLTLPGILRPILGIARDMDRHAPMPGSLIFTNPMIRVCDPGQPSHPG